MSASGWHREDIKAEIKKRGETLEGLSRKNGLYRGAVTAALLFPHSNGEAVIAEFLGVEAATLWPDRYDAKGQRLRPQSVPYASPKTLRRARSNGVCA